MFEVFVGLKLEGFWVDQNQAELFRGSREEQAGQQRVHTNGLPRARGSRN